VGAASGDETLRTTVFDIARGGDVSMQLIL